MGVENRDYYRQNNTFDGTLGDWGLYQLTPVVKWIIIVNVVVFVLQLLFIRSVPVSPLDALRQQDPELDHRMAEAEADPAAMAEVRKTYPQYDELMRQAARHPEWFGGEKISVLQDWFQLDTKKVLHGQVWRLLTHAFCHDRRSIFHIIFNMLFLYWFGCTLESMYGSREFLLFYLTAAVVAAFAYIALDLYTGSLVPAIGASGAVMAVTMLYAWHFPRDTICLMWFLRVEIRWLVVFHVIWDLYPVLLALSGDQVNSGIGHAAHLGGLAFGFLYGKFQWRLAPFLTHMPRFRWPHSPRFRLVPAVSDEEMDRVDEILEKIHRIGESHLTDEERTFLRDTSARMKRSRRA
jgi:membrane associated rhomboid family serine protease